MGFFAIVACLSRASNDSLVIFINCILGIASSGEFLVAAFLDITRTFDNIHPLAVINELKNAGTPAPIRKFDYSWIVHFIEDGIINDIHFTYKDTPQGSIFILICP